MDNTKKVTKNEDNLGNLWDNANKVSNAYP